MEDNIIKVKRSKHAMLERCTTDYICHCAQYRLEQ